MNDLGDAIAWPLRDREWLTKIVVMSLITLIPIVGGIVLLGWMLAALDNLRAGRQELPPIGFGYLERGFALFLVSIVYTLAVVAVAAVIFAGGFIVASGAASSSNAAAAAAGTLGLLLAIAVALAGMLAVLYLTPAVVLETDRAGIGAGLNLSQVVAIAQRRPESSLIAALSLAVAYLLGSLGSFVCGVGVYLTIAYGHAVAAGVVRRYELDLGSASTPLPAPPVTP